MKNCYGIDFRSWRKELRTREKTKQTPCKLPDRVSRSLQGVLFKVYQISVLILLKKFLFSFFSVCLPLFIRHIAAMLLRKTSSKTMQTVTKYLKELSGVRRRQKELEELEAGSFACISITCIEQQYRPLTPF